MKFNRADAKWMAAAQTRAWACYFIWRFYAIEPINSVTGFLEYVVFLVGTEMVYQFVKPMFIRKGM